MTTGVCERSPSSVNGNEQDESLGLTKALKFPNEIRFVKDNSPSACSRAT